MGLPDGQNQPAIGPLTAAIASGSTEAFAAFYQTWFDRCVESTMAMTRFDEATSLDIVQDAMMTAATQMPRCEEEGQLRAWLDRVLLNAARDRIRAETRRRGRERRPVRTGIERMPREQIEELDRHLQSLDEQQRSMLHLRYSLGWSLRRIANTLGLGGPGSIDGRIRRALAQLRAEYQDQDQDQEHDDE